MTRTDESPHGVTPLAARTLSTLAEMLRLYERAIELGTEAAASVSADGALEALGRRQAVVDALRERDAELGELRPRLDASPVPASDRAAVERKLAVVATAARRLADGDEALRRTLAERRDALADELSAVSRGRSAHTAYGRPPAPAARLSDTEV